MDNRQSILNSLYQAGGETVSGSKISEITGISRVAVWKHIKSLKASGIDILSQPRGYALVDPEDLLEPFCFPRGRQDRIFHFQKVESTMDKARELAREGAPHFSCVVSEHQSKSRGRLDRQWVSSKGGLWFTLILKPDLPPPLAWIFNFAASSCLSRVLSRMFDLDVRVKWPNDLLLNGEKLVGMLSEMETRADMINFLLLGIGLNVNNETRSESFRAASLKTALGRAVPRKKILAEFLTRFEELTGSMDPAQIIAQWKTRTATIGSRVRVETQNQIYEGIARDVDESGALIIEDKNNQIQKIIYGDCFHS
ncbi:biotin--[acetyl-CoA-carboxylase] ligase [Desulfospira joergensenii]|uniref:biotin--[acetyl-CoA-carboxylase] ligase n=1 Tax=Desulfospira joergensenii TaxID=53329 RepID=UPI0003B597EE|nr:biotin--[acetyl-CoA-carboxylase] ligase [Desulfospira joergensenii]